MIFSLICQSHSLLRLRAVWVQCGILWWWWGGVNWQQKRKQWERAKLQRSKLRQPSTGCSLPAPITLWIPPLSYSLETRRVKTLHCYHWAAAACWVSGSMFRTWAWMWLSTTVAQSPDPADLRLVRLINQPTVWPSGPQSSEILPEDIGKNTAKNKASPAVTWTRIPLSSRCGFLHVVSGLPALFGRFSSWGSQWLCVYFQRLVLSLIQLDQIRSCLNEPKFLQR